MKKNDLKNSIFLTGPACVGKTLLSEELGNNLNMPVVCVDELFMYVEYEMKGILNPSAKKQKEFINRYINILKSDKVLGRNFKNKNLADKQAELVYDYVDRYKKYVKMFGNLKPFYKIVGKFLLVCEKYKEGIEYIITYSAASTIVVQKIVEKLKYPVIFDTPAMFGWKLDIDKISKKYKNYLQNNGFNLSLTELDKAQEKLLKNSMTVFLEPGSDYSFRNAEKDSAINKLLVNHISNYYDYANVSITTNAIFNHPENKYFNKRSFFDAREYDVKEKLKNKCNIANICDGIILMTKDLNQSLQI